jgi:UDPglucose 6-dehydrogenase
MKNIFTKKRKKVSDKKTIGVIGLWHLGCTLCASWAKLGNKVVGFDHNSNIVDNLQQGIPPIFEPNLSETIKESVEKNLLTFSNDIKKLSQCDFIFLSYDTPVDDNDSCDTTILKNAILEIRNVMKNDSIIIVSSQTPVGTCRDLKTKLHEQNTTLDLAYSPENLRLGESINCYFNPGRIILGTSNKKTEIKCIKLFEQITNNIISMGLESSEMVKHGINSFLATSIVFANHMADICEFTQANIEDVVKGIKSDPRIGPKAYLTPGIGFSGGTLGRDLQALSSINKKNKKNATLFETIHKYNTERKVVIVNKIHELLGNVVGKTIGILGLTYKPGTSTLKRSIPLEITNALLEKNANVKVYDPKANYSELSSKPNFEIMPNIEKLSEKTDIIVLLTEWQNFKEYNWNLAVNKTKINMFFDTKNFLNKDDMEKSGFKYYSIGKQL